MNKEMGVMQPANREGKSVSPAEEPALQTTRELVADAIIEAIGPDAYDCTRVWDAWSVGTMGADDFVEVVADLDRVNEIADAAIAAMQSGISAEDRETLRKTIFIADIHGHVKDGESVLIKVSLLRRLREHAQRYLQQNTKAGLKSEATQSPQQVPSDLNVIT